MLTIEKIENEAHSLLYHRVMDKEVEQIREDNFKLPTTYNYIRNVKEVIESLELFDAIAMYKLFNTYDLSRNIKLEIEKEVMQNSTIEEGKLKINGMRPVKGINSIIDKVLTEFVKLPKLVSILDEVGFSFNDKEWKEKVQTVKLDNSKSLSQLDYNINYNINISYNNLDFLNCSENTTGWNSCFRNKGEYSASPTAFMTSPNTALMTIVSKEGKKIGRRWLFKKEDTFMVGQQYGTFPKQVVEKLLNIKLCSTTASLSSDNAIYCDNLYYDENKGKFNPYNTMEDTLNFNGREGEQSLFGSVCCCCDTMVDIDDICRDEEGSTYCESCYWDNFIECESCGDVHRRDETYETMDGTYYCCTSCAERDHYYLVSDSEYLVDIDETFYCIDEDVYYYRDSNLIYYDGCEYYEEGFYSRDYYEEYLEKGDDEDDS